MNELETDEYRSETLRSLIAPELDFARFGVILETAERRRGDCKRAGARSDQYASEVH